MSVVLKKHIINNKNQNEKTEKLKKILNDFILKINLIDNDTLLLSTDILLNLNSICNFFHLDININS